MTLKIALALCLAGTLLAADEHKTAEHKSEEHKTEPRKIETHSPEPPKYEDAKREDAKPSPAKAAEPKPAAAEVHRPTPRMTPRRNLAVRAASRAPRPETAASAPKPSPIVVEVKQEPARVEAVLRIVPYGAPGSGYPNQAFPQAAGTAQGPPETVVGVFGPANFAAANFTPAPSMPPFVDPQPQRNLAPPNTLKKAPKNALTNEGLVILAEAGYDEEFILDLMKMKNCHFDTSAEGLAYMATHGLTERLVKAALQADIESERKGPELEAHR